MEHIARNTADLAADERAAIEKFLGTQLQENQRVIVHVMDIGTASEMSPCPSLNSVDYAIFADLDDNEANDLTSAILQRSPGRHIDI